MAKIDQYQVTLELESVSPILKSIAEQAIREDYFIPARQELLDDFDNHVVTKEIQMGSEVGNSAGNPSNTLEGSSQKNLFTFIGFDHGTDPIKPLRGALQSSKTGPRLIPLPVKRRQFEYQFEIFSPDPDIIAEASPIPWAPGLSWAEMIEDGIPGLSNFIAKEGAGHSEGGYQSKHAIEGRSSDSRPVDYLSGIIRKFFDRLNK